MDNILVNKPKFLFFFIMFVFFFNMHNHVISQNHEYQTSLKIIVTRSDNGRRIPGAQITLYYKDYGTFTTNEQGEIFLSRKLWFSPDNQNGISSCFAQGYYPAQTYDFGPSSPGIQVKQLIFSKGNPNLIANIVLDPVSRSDRPLSGPILIFPQNTSVRQPGSIPLKWSTVHGAAFYQLQWSTNENMYSPKNQNQIPNVANRENQEFSINFNSGFYYWRVRASDGYKWGEWSEVYSFQTR